MSKSGKIQKLFGVLESRLKLSGPAEVIGPVTAAYSRFELEEDDETAPFSRLEVTALDPPRMQIDGRPESLSRGLDVAGQVYRRFVQLALDEAEAHAVLHAAALEGPRGAYLLAGPSGSGKSSLTLELLARGHRLLSDDYAPFDIDAGRIAPFGRALAVDPDGGAPLPRAVRGLARASSTPRLFGKALIDPAAVFGEDAIAGEAVPLDRVFLLTPDDPEAAPGKTDMRFDLVVRAQARRRFERAFSAIPGVRIERQESVADVARFALEATAGGTTLYGLAAALDDADVLYCEKTWGPSPDFDREANAVPVRRRLATTLLGREMLNRRSTSRLMRRMGHSTPRLFLELGHALRRTDCWQLSVGDLGGTADLIVRLLGARS